MKIPDDVHRILFKQFMLQRKGAPGIPDAEPVTIRQIPRRLHQFLIHLLTDETLLFRMVHMQDRIQHFHIPQITAFQFYKRGIHKRTVYIALRIPDRRYRPHGISLLIIYIYHNTPFPSDMASIWHISYNQMPGVGLAPVKISICSPVSLTNYIFLLFFDFNKCRW